MNNQKLSIFLTVILLALGCDSKTESVMNDTQWITKDILTDANGVHFEKGTLRYYNFGPIQTCDSYDSYDEYLYTEDGFRNGKIYQKNIDGDDLKSVGYYEITDDALYLHLGGIIEVMGYDKQYEICHEVLK